MRISDWSSDVCFSDLRDQWHTMTKTGKVNKLKQHISRPFVEIHPEDAVSRNIGDGDVVMIRSRRGQVRTRATVTSSIRPGVVFMPMHWGMVLGKTETRTNNLTSNQIGRAPCRERVCQYG